MSIITVFAIITASGLTYSILKEELLLQLLNGFMLIGLVLVLVGARELRIAGMTVFLLSIGVMTGYLLFRKDSEVKQKWLAVLSGVFVLSALVPRFMHWPFAGRNALLCGIPVILAIVWIFSNSKKDSRYLSPLIVLTPLCLIQFIGILQNINW